MDVDRELLEKLREDGDTVELPDGRNIRLKVEPEDYPSTPLQDHGDCWGKTSQYAYDYHHDGRTPRPGDFDGNAEKLQCGQGYWIWWQPPADVKRSDPGFTRLRSNVQDLCTYGFYSYGLELLDGIDAYRRAIVVAVAYLGGIEPFADSDYVQSVVSDLAYELSTD